MGPLRARLFTKAQETEFPFLVSLACSDSGAQKQTLLSLSHICICQQKKLVGWK